MNKSRAEQQNSQIIRAVKEWKGQICLLWLWIGDRISIWIQQRKKANADLRQTSWCQGIGVGCRMSPKECNWLLAARRHIRGNPAQCPSGRPALHQGPATVSTPCTFRWMFPSLLHVLSSRAACHCADVKQMSSPSLWWLKWFQDEMVISPWKAVCRMQEGALCCTLVQLRAGAHPGKMLSHGSDAGWFLSAFVHIHSLSHCWGSSRRGSTEQYCQCPTALAMAFIQSLILSGTAVSTTYFREGTSPLHGQMWNSLSLYARLRPAFWDLEKP